MQGRKSLDSFRNERNFRARHPKSVGVPARLPEGIPPFNRKTSTLSTSQNPLWTSLIPLVPGHTRTEVPARWADEH